MNQINLLTVFKYYVLILFTLGFLQLGYVLLEDKLKYNKNELARLIRNAEGTNDELTVSQVIRVLKCLKTLIKTDVEWLKVLLR